MSNLAAFAKNKQTQRQLSKTITTAEIFTCAFERQGNIYGEAARRESPRTEAVLFPSGSSQTLWAESKQRSRPCVRQKREGLVTVMVSVGSPGTHFTRLFIKSQICIIFPHTCGCFEDELAADWLTISHSDGEMAF